MLCSICRSKSETVPRSYFNVRYIAVCKVCDAGVEASKKKPYSKAMDAAAIAECGYFYNRKRARLY